MGFMGIVWGREIIGDDRVLTRQMIDYLLFVVDEVVSCHGYYYIHERTWFKVM